MPNAPKRYLQQVERKRDKIDPHKFNLLENLLVFRVLDNLSVPAESGVQFRISRTSTDAKGICLLIKVDHQQNPVVEDHELRPDYMALYLSGNLCVCTIIEMKGKDGKGTAHGLEQIKAFHDKLRTEFEKHLSKKFKIEIQGILLTAYGSQIPLPKITKLKQEGITILPVQYSNRAELFPYISKIVTTTERYEHQNCRDPRPLSELETLFATCALPSRVSQEWIEHPETVRDGICIDYALSNKDCATLVSKDRAIIIVINSEDETHVAKIQHDLNASGLNHKIQTMRAEVTKAE